MNPKKENQYSVSESEKQDKIETLKNDYEKSKDTEQETTEKRGRPKGSKSKKKQYEEIESKKEHLINTLSIVSDYIIITVSESMPKKIKPTETELKLFSNAHSALLDKHFTSIAEYSEETAVIALWFMFLISRIETNKFFKNKQTQKPDEKQKSNSNSGNDRDGENTFSEKDNKES